MEKKDSVKTEKAVNADVKSKTLNGSSQDKPQADTTKPAADQLHNGAEKDRAKIEELTQDLKRLQADFENYKKRCEKESASFRQFASADLIKRLLVVLDSFEMALKTSANPEEFRKGVELIYAQLYNVLKEEGLSSIEAKGRFDPYLHEVMLSEKSELPEDEIIEELQKGYRLKDRVLRHSKVKVSKGK